MTINKILLSIIFAFITYCQASSQILINEVQLVNKGVVVDQDNEYPSWIELYNAGNAAVNMKGYSLTDDSNTKARWKFPSIIIPAGGRQLVFLSGKDTAEKIDHWESVVYAYDDWQYILTDTVWDRNTYELLAPDFPANGWSAGKGGIGLGDNDDSTIIKATYNYNMRQVFKLKNKDLTNLKKCYLQIDNENLCYAYINYSYIGTFNNNSNHIRNGKAPLISLVDINMLKYYFTYYDSLVLELRYYHAKDSFHQTSIPFLSFGFSDTVTHVYNNRKNQWLHDHLSYYHSNFKIKAGETVFLYNSSGTLLDYKQILHSNYDISYARIPDGGKWCITNEPTPDSTNNGKNCYGNFLNPPTFWVNTGMVNSGSTVKVTTNQANCIIRYTKNGDVPDSNSLIYKTPIKITADVVIRAACFDTTKTYFQSKPITNTYIIKDKSFKLPIISIVADSLDLFNASDGLYATNGYIGAEKRASHIEYMLSDGKLQFELDADLSIHGNGSRGYNKKSLRVETSTKYDSSFIHYKLFPFRNYTDIYAFNLRSGSQDQGGSMMRDELTNHIMLNSNIDVMEHNSCVVYLNGMFWGIYHIREKQDNDYLNNVSGADRDSIDLIGIWGVHYGNNTAFYKLINLYSDSLNIPRIYDSLNKYLDIKSYADYLILETFICNNDWPGNNTKLWRSTKVGGKFRYLLYDTDYGTWDTTTNKIAALMAGNWYGLNTIKYNLLFKTYFVNRYADLINTTLSLNNYRANYAYIKNKLDYDMPKEITRWGNYASMQGWYDGINYIDTFVRKRTVSARNQIQTDFSLNNQVNLTLNVNPVGAGVVKLNTIIPTSFPWKGVYFDGVPITVTAVPNPGFTFDSMVVNGSVNTNKSLTKNLTQKSNTITFYYNGSGRPLKIAASEINYNCNDKLNSGSWIELHNYDTMPVDMTGYKIKTSKDYAYYEIEDNYILPANGYVVICEDTTLFKQVYPNVPNRIGNIGFPLYNHHDSIVLIDNKGKNKIAFVYNDTLPWPENVNGTGRTLELRYDSLPLGVGSSWFNGCIGGSPGRAYTSCIDNVIISEINYNSKSTHDAGEWVELYNNSNSNITLSGWHFKDGSDAHDYIIPNGTVLKANGYLVLYNNLAKFSAQHPLVTNIAGPFTFGLSNNGENLRLFDNKLNPKFSMKYYNEIEGWPAKANGKGYTLELDKKNDDYSDRINWVQGCLYGSPGKERDICPEDVVLVPTELNYKPLAELNAGDWIELENIYKDTINISNWKLKTNSTQYNLPNIYISPKNYIIIAEDTSKLYNAFPNIDKKKVFQLSLLLNDSADRIMFLDSANVKRFEMYYIADSNNQYAKGDGYTLQLQKIPNTYNEYSVPANWRRGCFLGNPLEFGNTCDERIGVSEINFNGDSLKKTADWVEVYNYGNRPINLNGYTVATTNTVDTWQTNKICYPKNRILITTDSNNLRTNYNLGSDEMKFSLAQSDTITISNLDLTNITKAVYDSTTAFYANGLGKTIESVADTNYITNSSLWREGCFGGSPSAAYGPCPALGVVVSEIDYKNIANFNTGNWYELWNIDSMNSKNISNYYISFGEVKNITQLDSNTGLLPNAKTVFLTDTNAFKFYFPFAISKIFCGNNIIKEGWVRIWDYNRNPVFVMKYDNSFGGNGNGKTISLTNSSYILDDYSNKLNWEEGCIGGSPVNYKGWCDTTLQVSEINYQSSLKNDAGDWLEISNPTNTTINMNGMYIYDSKDKQYILQGNLFKDSIAVITSDSVKFGKEYPACKNKFNMAALELEEKGNIRIFGADKSLLYMSRWSYYTPWNDSADGKGYTLEFNKQYHDYSDAGTWFIGCLGGSPGKKYAADCYIIPDTTNGISNKELSEIYVAPNPTSGTITVYFSENTSSRHIAIYDAKGAAIHTFNSYHTAQKTIDMSGFERGIYFMVIYQNGSIRTLKFVKE